MHTLVRLHLPAAAVHKALMPGRAEGKLCVRFGHPQHLSITLSTRRLQSPFTCAAMLPTEPANCDLSWYASRPHSDSWQSAEAAYDLLMIHHSAKTCWPPSATRLYSQTQHHWARRL